MPTAAVPAYLGDRFEDASPGMRFGMYLKCWTPGQYQADKNKRDALREACNIGAAGKALDAWLARQQALAGPLLAAGRLARFEATAVAPFATGLGNEHPTENGFAFLWPYGLPYLPGSGVKGVLRAAARELDWPDDERVALFGSDPPGDDNGDLQRGALSFWDVLPKIEGDRLMVDVMTPHQTHYYQPRAGGARRDDKNTAGSSNPHDSGAPNPIYFLTVPPRSRFVFHVACDLERLPQPLRDGGRWRERLAAAFEHAFEWLGFGAKTAVGYGAMKRDLKAEQAAWQAAQSEREATERAARISAMTEAMRQIDAFIEAFKERARQLRGGKDKANTEYHSKARKLAKAALDDAGWTAEERRAAAAAIEEWLPKVVQVDMKVERKNFKLASLKG